MGFMSREEISQKLSLINKPAFLLRFSDSKLGTISVSSFKHDGTGSVLKIVKVDRNQAFHLQSDETFTVLTRIRET